MGNDFDYLELEEEHVEALSGINHLCPLCFNKLSSRRMPGYREEHWHCESCGTEWKVLDLIAALNHDELKEVE